jgi:hypothetical protein
MNENSFKNLKIWNEVETTDTDHTKPGTVSGQNITSINPTSVYRKATEIFGPVGIGWGYNIVDERFDKGMPIFKMNEETKKNEQIAHVLVHTLRLRLWYILDGVKGEVEHFGHTPFVQKSRLHGAVQDMESSKKSLTDAIKKCLSMLGFNADIFLGMFDSRDYVENLKIEEEIQKSDDIGKASVEKHNKLRADIEIWANGYTLIPYLATLNKIHSMNSKKLEKKCRVLNLSYSKAVIPLHLAFKDAEEHLNKQLKDAKNV